jgi:3-hydroxybutyryl-CoA dehydrogenase
MNIAVNPHKIKKVVAIGAGTMGVGTAVASAIAGYDVTFFVRDKLNHESAMAGVDEILALLESHALIAKAEACAVKRRISVTANELEAAADADLIWESIPEDMHRKRVLFMRWDKICPPHTIFATNTSGLDPTEMYESLSIQRRRQSVVMHGYNPPEMMPLVEIVPAADTTHDTLNSAEHFLVSIGKKPVVLNHASPGFIVNYIQFAIFWKALEIHIGGTPAAVIDTAFKKHLGERYEEQGPIALAGIDVDALSPDAAKKLLAKRLPLSGQEPGSICAHLQETALRKALELVANGVAPAAGVDAAFKISLGRRYKATGPFESADLTGLDTVRAILERQGHIVHETAKSRFLDERIASGRIGLKKRNLSGIYNWSQQDADALKALRVKWLVFHLQGDVQQRHVRRRDAEFAITPAGSALRRFDA